MKPLKKLICLIFGHEWKTLDARRGVCECCGARRYKLTRKYLKGEQFVIY